MKTVIRYDQRRSDKTHITSNKLYKNILVFDYYQFLDPDGSRSSRHPSAFLLMSTSLKVLTHVTLKMVHFGETDM